MSFIANNPLTIPEVENSPSVPNQGTRGIFAGKDGWYIIDSNGVVNKIATTEEISDLIEKVNFLYKKSLVKTAEIYLPASGWEAESANRYYQVVTVTGITPYSKVDLQPTAEQLTVFHEKDIAFVTENKDEVVTVYCIGQEPESDYTIQATITEVEVDE